MSGADGIRQQINVSLPQVAFDRVAEHLGNREGDTVIHTQSDSVELRFTITQDVDPSVDGGPEHGRADEAHGNEEGNRIPPGYWYPPAISRSTYWRRESSGWKKGLKADMAPDG